MRKVRIKRFTALILSLLFIMMLSSCYNTPPVNPSEDDISVSIIMNEMNMDEDDANDFLGFLKTLGLDDEIDNIYYDEDGDEPFYKIWYGINYMKVFFDGDEIIKVIKNTKQIFPVSNKDNESTGIADPNTDSEETEFPKNEVTESKLYAKPEEAPTDTKVETPAETLPDTSAETTFETPAGTTPETPFETSPDTPTETKTETPADTPTETPDETSPVDHITIVSLTSPISRGKKATIVIRGIPYTEYDIAVFYTSGESKAEGLEPKNSGQNGEVSWTWRVGSSVKPGEYLIRITSGDNVYETTFTVTSAK